MNVIRAIIAGLLGITTLHLVPITALDTVLDAITADSLETQIVPYVKAVTDLQRTIAEIKERDFENPIILKIETGSYNIKWRYLYAEVNHMLKKIMFWRNENEALLANAIAYHHNMAEFTPKGTIPPANLSEEGQEVKRKLDQKTDDLIKALAQEIALDSLMK